MDGADGEQSCLTHLNRNCTVNKLAGFPRYYVLTKCEMDLKCCNVLFVPEITLYVAAGADNLSTEIKKII